VDWIDEVFEMLKNKINNLSLKKALVVYIVISLAIIGVLIAITQGICVKWDYIITHKYYDEYVVDTYVVNAFFHYDYSRFNRTDRIMVEIIDFIQSWSIVIYSIAGIIGVSYFYYNNKLKEPLRILSEAADQVGNNNLDIEIYYDKYDEMGKLCRSFDTMRKQLIANNQKMWDMMEEQKRINAAFAHDLRTPLTVLRGYIDLLSKYIPEGKINEEKLMSTISLMSDHIRRLENYSNTMKEIGCLEEMPVKRKEIKACNMAKKLCNTVEVMNGKDGITVSFISDFVESSQLVLLDEEIVLEVFDNLVSNALRYAKSHIDIILSLSEDNEKLLLSVADDGKGFRTTDLKMATKAYYTDSKNKNSNHFGIGLYICKILCEKHNGFLTLENGMDTGAIVTAAFGVR